MNFKLLTAIGTCAALSVNPAFADKSASNAERAYAKMEIVDQKIAQVLNPSAEISSEYQTDLLTVLHCLKSRMVQEIQNPAEGYSDLSVGYDNVVSSLGSMTPAMGDSAQATINHEGSLRIELKTLNERVVAWFVTKDDNLGDGETDRIGFDQTRNSFHGYSLMTEPISKNSPVYEKMQEAAVGQVAESCKSENIS